jgi:hypothetical protein
MLLSTFVNGYLLCIHEPPDVAHRKLEYSGSLEHLRKHKKHQMEENDSEK